MEKLNFILIYTAFVLLICLLSLSSSQTDSLQLAKDADNYCSNYDETCSGCIQEHKCQWCSNLHDNTTNKHCFASARNLTDLCDKIENPEDTSLITTNKPLSEVVDAIIQFKPQKFKLQLRKGKPLNITCTFRQVKDYPLDLYYLMDLSHSMREDKKTLAAVGQKLAATMRKLTPQFQIGFGSFVDKVLLPFTDTSPKAMDNPCPGTRDPKHRCVTPFSFRNNLNLTDDDDKFVKQVNAAKLSGNLDSPEGGFDALMQAMVCTDIIGWRNQTRKIIVFSTDAQFHSAGDGKLAGVIEPNDGKCHLNSENMYDKYQEYDYPSIQHINEVAKLLGFNILFAVKENKILYQKLAQVIDGAFHEELKSKSTNIVQVIQDVYKNITAKVEIKQRQSDHMNLFSLRFFSDCSGREGGSSSSLLCNNVKGRDQFDVTVEVTLKECPAKSDSRTATINFGTQEESVSLEIDMLCECQCEKEHITKTAKKCTNQGVLQCGRCKCDKNYFGDMCQCTTNRTESGVTDMEKCKANNASETGVCSGRGTCRCEKCECWDKDYYGKYCQWNKALCRHKHSVESCSGHGTCEGEKCECNDDWTGAHCECRNERACKAKGDTELCSGNGDCICGRCSCRVKNNVLYTGEFCEDCQTCRARKCSFFRPCVQCKKWSSGTLDSAACEANCANSTENLQVRKSLEDQVKKGAKSCTFIDASTNCYFTFTYQYLLNGNYKILVESQQNCEGVDPVAVIFGGIGAVVAIGILTLLLWKIVTTIHDQREYAKFMKEMQNPKWATNENKLYQPAVTKVDNPAYGH